MTWIQTLGSGRFDLLHPDPSQIHFPDIATVLSRIPRFGGHTEHGPYSVAQHCSEGARAVLRDTGRRDWAAAFLLHDAHEAYIGDIASPVICALGIAGQVRELKARLDAAIFQAAGLQWPMSPACLAVVKEYDVRMLRTERDARMATPPAPWVASVEAAQPVSGVSLWSGDAEWARDHFWEQCVALLPSESR